MDEKLINAAIEKVLGMITANLDADKYLKLTQSALNLAHARQLLVGKSK